MKSIITLLALLALGGCASIREALYDRLPNVLDPRPEAPAKPAPDSGFPAGTKWLHTDVSGWKQTATLGEVRISGSMIHLPYNKARVWPGKTGAGTSANVNANAWILVERGGQWYACTWEWLRPGQTSKSKSAVTGAKMRGELSNFTPKSGERYGFFVSGLARGAGRNVQERSQVVWMVWP